jgi:regulatory protein
VRVDEGTTTRRQQASRSGPRKLTARSLENAALHYLKRYSATAAGVRAVLLRRVDRALRVHGGDRAVAQGWVDELVEKLERAGLIDDAGFAQMKASSLRASGRSAKVIAQKLRLKGVPQDILDARLAEVTGEISELAAARHTARKKRLGPFRKDPEGRAEQRERDMARLARAGFSYDVVRQVIEGRPDSEQD